MKRTFGDRAFDAINFVLLLLITLLCLYPFWYVLAISLNNNAVSSYINVVIWPKQVTFQNYKVIFDSPWLVSGFKIATLRTVVATFLSVMLSGGLAYALSRKDLVGRQFFGIFILIPMYLSGGMIPTYLLLRSLNLLNTFPALFITGLISTWNTVLMRTSIAALPNGLIESANIDGANDIRIYFRIIIPCALPIFATITLFVAVMQWNDWFAGDMYITNEALKPIQTIMLNIINRTKAADMAKKMGSVTGEGAGTMVESIKMAAIMLTVIPIVMVYPFLQKYFVKGIMVGSLKG